LVEKISDKFPRGLPKLSPWCLFSNSNNWRRGRRGAQQKENINRVSMTQKLLKKSSYRGGILAWS